VQDKTPENRPARNSAYHATGEEWGLVTREAGARKSGGHRTVLFPIRIDDAIQQTHRAWARKVVRSRHIGGFREWKEHDAYQEAFERLLRDLRQAGDGSS
jgi:hypothetical protein